ncbi:MAG TPA: tetratricopeptide repeat protein [Bryobacteraceae bacterium]|nr:tetratricopeptide repeat protein [Bryobacteraceae bacterium]
MWWPATFALLLFLQSSDPQAAGLKALEEQRYEAAIENFKEAIAADPANYGAHFHLALAYSLLGRDADAIPEYSKVLDLKPHLYEAELNLGILLLRQQQGAAAVPYLDSAARQKPGEFRPNLFAAEAHRAAGEFEKAESSYKTALAIDPRSAPAEAGLARAQLKQNRLPEARTHFEKAASLDPAFQEGLLELASAYEANKQNAEALEIYRQLPGNTAARERMGELLLQSGRLADAITELETIVQKAPSAANRQALASAYMQNKQGAKAVPLLRLAVEQEPANLELRGRYARALRDQKNYPAAAQEFYRVAQAKPESGEAWSDLAAMLILIEKDEPALAALDKVRALGYEKPGHLFFRAVLLDRNKQFQPALENYEKFLSLSQGKSPDEEFKARQRVNILKKELRKK